MPTDDSFAIFDGELATDLVEVSSDPECLDRAGWWVVAATFEGEFRAYRFATRQPWVPYENAVVRVERESWVSDTTEAEYQDGVRRIRDDIARGWVYQVNLCRRLSAQVPVPLDVMDLHSVLTRGNPAPYAGCLQVIGHGESDCQIVSASPELLVRRIHRTITSGPIKGTATSAAALLTKDRDENVMIVDLVRNDLSRIAIDGTVEVPALLRLEEHPGLVHLVSDISAQLAQDVTWREILTALLPAGSVSGAPKHSALEVIGRLERNPRGIYCGAFGWVDADAQRATLAVGIRTFWQEVLESGTYLHFGTGAGITWGSDPAGEWQETQLKANRLFDVLAGVA